jgi:hypothetical protein
MSCSRDNELRYRSCSFCGQGYYGSLGHIGCRGFVPKMKKEEKPAPPPEEPEKDDPPF